MIYVYAVISGIGQGFTGAVIWLLFGWVGIRLFAPIISLVNNGSALDVDDRQMLLLVLGLGPIGMLLSIAIYILATTGCIWHDKMNPWSRVYTPSDTRISNMEARLEEIKEQIEYKFPKKIEDLAERFEQESKNRIDREKLEWVLTEEVRLLPTEIVEILEKVTHKD